MSWTLPCSVSNGILLYLCLRRGNCKYPILEGLGVNTSILHLDLHLPHMKVTVRSSQKLSLPSRNSRVKEGRGDETIPG